MSPTPFTPKLPTIIQGGMGVAVSSWHLARQVSMAGELGVVSGTALDVVLARKLQDGDLDGHCRRALAAFPLPEVADRLLERYFIEGGKEATKPYRPTPTLGLKQNLAAQELAVAGNFVEVWLAKEGHDGIVGINFLEKIQMATPAAAYGAMLADVDYVLMGAGIPAEIPAMLNDFAIHQESGVGVDVADGTMKYRQTFDPQLIEGDTLPPLKRPMFLAIVSSHILAAFLFKTEATRPDGFVIEGIPAGGHNTPPRGKMQLNERGEPIYGPRDVCDFDKLGELGLPFWLAGGCSTPEQVQDALKTGARGVQIGTLFALCNDSGLINDVRKSLHSKLADGTLDVKTDALASPTGFPFKVAQLEDTISNEEVYQARERLCDLGYLRTPYERSPGQVGYRCASEPVDIYVRKGGDIEATVGRKCLCNGLMSSIGLGQTRPDGYHEAALSTLGSDLTGSRVMLNRHPEGWSAHQAIDFVMGRSGASA